MKTIKIKLLATMVTLATVIITTTIPATAQRRQSQNSKAETRVEKNVRNRANAVQKKSTFKHYDSNKRSSRNTSVRSKRDVQQKSTPAKTRGNFSNKKTSQIPVTTRSNSSNTNRRVTTGRVPQNNSNKSRRSVSPRSENRVSTSTKNNRDRKNASNRKETVISGRISTKQDGIKQYNPVTTRRNTGKDATRTSTRNTSNNRRDIYKLNNNDPRYIPNSNYRGSSKNWSNKNRSNKMNYNRNDNNFYRNYDYNKCNHWDRRWEKYRWNLYSWRDYYRGYNPYSYRFQKYYYYDHRYGHVIRKFIIRPNIFIHNHSRYYSYNGHFFRYRRGIGYILVDLPFGLIFEQLPYDYERVYINGYLYFRIGNLFFEHVQYGFRLVHYPERYFAYNDDFENEGYYSEDDYYNY